MTASARGKWTRNQSSSPAPPSEMATHRSAASIPTRPACRRSGSPDADSPPVNPHADRTCPGTPGFHTISTAAIRPATAVPFGPCMATPVRSADTDPTVSPSASFDQSHAFAGPNVSPAATRAPSPAPDALGRPLDGRFAQP